MKGTDPGDEAVYDLYLESCAAGRPEPPDAVFARHPGLDSEVRSRIEGLWRSAPGRDGTPASPGRLGPYLLVERLETGGMGTVYRALRQSDGAEVAVKVLRPELAGSPTAVERLRREALALSRLHHPHVVRVHEFGADGPVSFLVLDLVPGRGLDSLVAEAATRGASLPPDRVVRWGAALARGLEAAHGEGVIHRDVKPSNVQVRPDDSPVLLDFGIAQVPERTPGALTTTFAGSPYYAAPEQLTGAPVDGRTDVYGLCATLYQCLTGRVPFAGDRFEDVLRRTLSEEPVAVRRLAPDVPRDVETVVLAGLEKEPARRPESATALAEDLEAILLGAPVRARRPGPLRVLARAARRRPLAAAGLVLALLAGPAWIAGSAAVRAAGRERVLEEARGALREAEALTDAYAQGSAGGASVAAAVREGEENLLSRWLPEDEVALHEKRLRELEHLQRDRDVSYLGILAQLDRVERLAPGLDGPAACRARLYLLRWRAAQVAGDTVQADLYREMVERADPGGPSARSLSASARLSVAADPPDAAIHLFRVVHRESLVAGGGNRLVPVPWRAPGGPAAGAPWALRVVRGSVDLPAGAHVLRVAGQPIEGCVFVDAARPPLRTFDRLRNVDGAAVRDVVDARRLGADGPEREFAFDRGGEEIRIRARSLGEIGATPVSPADVARRGGAAASVWDDGTIRETRLPEGLDVRATAAPLLAGPASRLDPAEAAGLPLPPGEYVVLLLGPGRLDLRLPVVLATPGVSVTLRPRLPLKGERPPGCVPVPGRVDSLPDRWIQDREVTAAEYLEFLNAPETRAAVDASPRPILVPRHDTDPPLWPRGADGAFRLPESTAYDHPVLGVSFEDARAYAAWRTARSAAAGEPWRWRLPEQGEWSEAAGSGIGRRFPFGPRFRPSWASSNFRRPYPAPEPVLSHPVDESVYGVFDMCGSAMEWVTDWYDEPRGLRRLRGGSWAQGWPEALAVWAPRGARPDRADREFGFRLVGERASAEPR